MWLGRDNAWEQRKLDARKILKNRAESHTLAAPKKMAGHHFEQENIVMF